MASRVVYTIPEPERSMFRALSVKTGVSEAELVRRFIRWACKLAGVPAVASSSPAAGLAACVYTDSAGDSSGESLGESSVNQVAESDSRPVYGLTAGG